MADTVILGVYATKSALDSAHGSGNTKGDSYIVGSKCPYALYTWSGSDFTKGVAVGTKATLSIGIDDVNESIAFSSLVGKTIKDSKNRDVKLIQAVGKGLELYELAGA